MSLSKLFTWIIVIAIAIFAWKTLAPKLREGKAAKSEVADSGGSCGVAAARASERWGSGLSRFVNPPYDLNAWSSFRTDVDSAIADAESDCDCAGPSCEKGRAALRDLRALVSDFDAAIRNGSEPPADAVQRQESIDNRINEAR